MDTNSKPKKRRIDVFGDWFPQAGGIFVVLGASASSKLRATTVLANVANLVENSLWEMAHE